MKLKTDENLPFEAASTLRACGFDAETVWDESMSGANDQAIAARCLNEGRILLTLDLDFTNIQAYPPNQHPGIIVLRRKAQDKVTVVASARRVAAVLGQRSPVSEYGSLSVIGSVFDKEADQTRDVSLPLTRRGLAI